MTLRPLTDRYPASLPGPIPWPCVQVFCWERPLFIYWGSLSSRTESLFSVTMLGRPPSVSWLVYIRACWPYGEFRAPRELRRGQLCSLSFLWWVPLQTPTQYLRCACLRGQATVALLPACLLPTRLGGHLPVALGSSCQLWEGSAMPRRLTHRNQG